MVIVELITGMPELMAIGAILVGNVLSFRQLESAIIAINKMEMILEKDIT